MSRNATLTPELIGGGGGARVAPRSSPLKAEVESHSTPNLDFTHAKNDCCVFVHRIEKDVLWILPPWISLFGIWSFKLLGFSFRNGMDILWIYPHPVTPKTLHKMSQQALSAFAKHIKKRKQKWNGSQPRHSPVPEFILENSPVLTDNSREVQTQGR